MKDKTNHGAEDLSPRPFLKTNELAGRWALCERTVREMTRNGTLKVLRVGRSVRVPMDEVLRFESESLG